jgi:hypothetical protein
MKGRDGNAAASRDLTDGQFAIDRLGSDFLHGMSLT